MIRGERVDLVAVSLRYLEHYYKWINDPDVADMLGIAHFPISIDSEREWVEKQLQPELAQRHFTILTKQGRPIGNIGFNSIDYTNRSAVIGVMIGEKRLWDKGYGTDAVRTLLRFAFETMGLNKVSLKVASANARALACYKKCGFVVEGIDRKQRFYRGKYIDEIWMGILAEEWRVRQKGARGDELLARPRHSLKR